MRGDSIGKRKLYPHFSISQNKYYLKEKIISQFQIKEVKQGDVVVTNKQKISDVINKEFKF
jgi:hypothetical protein